MRERSNVLFFFCIISSVITANNAAPAHDVCSSQGLRVHLTVSSLVSETTSRQLEVHWSHAEPQHADWIGIFDTEPVGAPLPTSLAVLTPGNSNKGWARTQVTEQNRPNSSELLGFKPKCLGYYVGYVRNDEILASNCLRLEPTWMSERSGLGGFSLPNIFIPATHNSGAWGEYDPFTDTQITKYTVCQDEDILSQLIRGIRHLDIRVAYYPGQINGSGFWLNHGYFRMHNMETVISQVRTFLDNTPNTEIVIFDLHEFTPGFISMLEHDKFVEFLHQEFEFYIIPRDNTLGWSSTLNDLWATQKRLIVSYDDMAVAAKYTWLWQGAQHKWGNVRSLKDLNSYLTGVMANPPSNNRLWSAMAELTPTAFDVITDALGGLRVMADTVNRNVTSWFKGHWGATVNAVAVDFFRGTDIVQTALDWNDRRILRRSGQC